MDYVLSPKPERADSWRWDTPPENQGQIIEVQYSWGIPVGLCHSTLACHGAPWQRNRDHSLGGTELYQVVWTHKQEIQDEILDLKRRAHKEGDCKQIALCDDAIQGGTDAWNECVRILNLFRDRK